MTPSSVEPSIEEVPPPVDDSGAPPIPKQADSPRRISPLAIGIGIAATLLVVFAVWALASQAKIVVPDVTGLPSAVAQARLTDAGLTMVVANQEASQDVAAGSIISQDPKPGNAVQRDAPVAVTVSTGRSSVTVPSVMGISLDAASGTLTGMGLQVGTVSQATSSDVATGSVISQTPAAGEQATDGSAVDVVVSVGLSAAKVPDVVGMSQTVATVELEGAGLVVDVATVYSDHPVGSVLAQGPEAGTAVAAGSTVTISVSKGQPPVKTPNVVGALEPDAKISLQNLGLVPVSVTTTGTPGQIGRVLRQEPIPGTNVDKGSQVKIFVAR